MQVKRCEACKWWEEREPLAHLRSGRCPFREPMTFGVLGCVTGRWMPKAEAEELAQGAEQEGT